MEVMNTYISQFELCWFMSHDNSVTMSVFMAIQLFLFFWVCFLHQLTSVIFDLPHRIYVIILWSALFPWWMYQLHFLNKYINSNWVPDVNNAHWSLELCSITKLSNYYKAFGLNTLYSVCDCVILRTLNESVCAERYYKGYK